MKKVLIAAYELRHAEYYAREVLQIPKTQFKFINDALDVRGWRGFELIMLHAPRYKPTSSQMEKRYILSEVSLACGLIIKEVTLP